MSHASSTNAFRSLVLCPIVAAIVVATPLPAGDVGGSAPPQCTDSRASDAHDSPVAVDSPERLLQDLEKVTDELADFSARIVYERFDGLTEESELRYGRVIYVRPKSPDGPWPEGGRHRMAILLDEFVDGGGRKETIDQRYVWADGWLVDIDGARRQFIKRQIAPPDSDHDPLRIGEGPFPLPIGQRRADVEARFEVHSAPPPEGRLAGGIEPETLRSLRLVPRRGVGGGPGADVVGNEEFRSIDLHYDRSTLLPVLVIAEGVDDSIRTVRLLRPLRNVGLTDDDLALLSAQTPDPAAWTIDVRPWRTSAGD